MIECTVQYSPHLSTVPVTVRKDDNKHGTIDEGDADGILRID